VTRASFHSSIVPSYLTQTFDRELLPADRLRLTFETTEAALEQVARWLMQYGPQARALRPPALCDLLRERIRRAAVLYDQDTEETEDD